MFIYNYAIVYILKNNYSITPNNFGYDVIMKLTIYNHIIRMTFDPIAISLH